MPSTNYTKKEYEEVDWTAPPKTKSCYSNPQPKLLGHELRQVVANHRFVVEEDTIRMGTCLVVGDETFVGNIILHKDKRLLFHNGGYGNLQAYLYVYELNNVYDTGG